MSRLLIDEQPLQVIPSLACKIGLNRAMFLQQLHYWLQKSGHERDGKKWIFNTYEEWHEQFPFWKPETIRKLVKSLEDLGLIITTSKYNKVKTDRTKWYTIDYDRLNAPVQPENRTGSEPENRTASNQREPESNNRDSLRGADAPEKPAKAMTTLTVDRTREAGFHAPPYQIANWGKGWAGFIYVPEGEEPPSAERQFAVLSEIVAAAAGRRGKGRFFLSVEDAIKRVEGEGFAGKKSEQATPMSSARRKAGYEWLFDEKEAEDKRDLDAELRKMREEGAA